MNPRQTWIWLAIAAGLGAIIFFFHPHPRVPAVPPKIVPNLVPDQVLSIQVRPFGQLEIRLDRTNDTWQLTAPLATSANTVAITNLLNALAKLTPVRHFDRKELAGQTNVDETFGFQAPQASLILLQGDYRAHLIFGALTAPGDQVYLQLAGDESVFVVDSSILKLIPKDANGWRDPTLLDLNTLGFDRVIVSNPPAFFELQRDVTNDLWRMVRPTPARGYNARIEEALQALQAVRAIRFVSDDPKADFDAVGLHPPTLEISFAKDTNLLATLQFGKAPTNEPKQVFARRAGESSLVTVSADLLAPWRLPLTEFRDPHLVVLTAPVSELTFRGEDTFSLVRQTNDSWEVLPQGFTADPVLVKDLLLTLAELQVAQFVKDVVTELDLPAYGLAPPALTIGFLSPVTNAAGVLTNQLLAEVSFGTNREDKVMARRADESFVYAVRAVDIARFPSASFQMRDRRIWNFSTNDVARVIVRDHGVTQTLVREGPYDWKLAEGSQGMIKNVLAIEETIRPLTQLTAESWVALGATNRARFALTNAGPEITLELKDGSKRTLEVGGELPSALPCIAVNVDGEIGVFRLPYLLHRDLVRYLGLGSAGP